MVVRRWAALEFPSKAQLGWGRDVLQPFMGLACQPSLSPPLLTHTDNSLQWNFNFELRFCYGFVLEKLQMLLFLEKFKNAGKATTDQLGTIHIHTYKYIIPLNLDIYTFYWLNCVWCEQKIKDILIKSSGFSCCSGKQQKWVVRVDSRCWGKEGAGEEGAGEEGGGRGRRDWYPQ